MLKDSSPTCPGGVTSEERRTSRREGKVTRGRARKRRTGGLEAWRRKDEEEGKRVRRRGRGSENGQERWLERGKQRDEEEKGSEDRQNGGRKGSVGRKGVEERKIARGRREVMEEVQRRQKDGRNKRGEQMTGEEEKSSLSAFVTGRRRSHKLRLSSCAAWKAPPVRSARGARRVQHSALTFIKI